jgi:hypothetical protein
MEPKGLPLQRLAPRHVPPQPAVDSGMVLMSLV